MSGAQVMEMVETQGKRLEKPDKCPEHTYQLMLRCWDLQSEKRPTFAELHQIFKTNPLYSDVEINA
ncbi:tyrosine- kinase HTK16-like [Paramuricea clavata]|nr:tyrosine- kinase HTK16-like [Paramuricea clavata]